MSLTELLVPQAVFLQDDAQDANTIIQRLGRALNQQGYVTDDFVEATLRREATMPTGLPLEGAFNAAIPHVDPEYVRKPAIALATLKEPVVFHHMVMTDEEIRVQLVIMLALNQPKAQVETLQQVTRLLQRSDLVDRLMAALAPDDVISILSGLEIVP